MDLHGCDLIGADMTNANRYYAYLYGADMTNANLTGALMDYANLTNADLTGVTWSGTTCPNGAVQSTPCA